MICAGRRESGMGKYLLLGRGSIGRKHQSILESLGHTVVSVDPSPLAGADYKQAFSIECVPPWYKETKAGTDMLVVAWEDFDGVLDCTPAGAGIRAGWQIPAKARFIEKPLGGVPDRKGCNEPVQIGFCYRFLPSLQQFREALVDVRVFSLTMLAGAWLPDWHPDEDYRERYHGTPGVGGVVNDSLSHSLFIARWLLGELSVAGSIIGKLGGLDVSTEDTAATLLRAATGQPVYILVDYLRRPGDSTIEAVTSGGVKVWEMNPEEAPEMYRAQMETFVRVCANEQRFGYPTLADGVAVQLLLDEVRNGEMEARYE